jgi:lysozyme family protein
MAKTNFSNCLGITLVYEGSTLSTIKSDPGNWTGGAVGKGTLKGSKYGISAAAFPNLDIASLTVADVSPIYKAKYWDVVRGDDLPAGLDLATWDYGVNSGTWRAIKDLQASVGRQVDGAFGPQTLAAVQACDVQATIKAICAKRLGYLHGLKIWNTFKGGWSARVANVEAKGVAMYLATVKTPAEAKAALLDESAKADAAAKSKSSAAGGIVTGGAISVPAGATTLDHPWAWVALGLALAGIAAALVVSRHNSAARSAAYADVAASVAG